MRTEGFQDGAYGLSSLSKKTRESDQLQMQLQKQRFPLSYLNTVSVDVARVRTHNLPNASSDQLSQPVGAWPCWLSESSRHISTGHE